MKLQKLSKSTEFCCRNGLCIASENRCDSSIDYVDNSDEEDCEVVAFPYQLTQRVLHQNQAAQLSIIVIIKCFVVKYVLVIIMFIICRTFLYKRKCTFYIYSIAESIGLNDVLFVVK